MIARLLHGVPRHALVLLAAVLAVLVAAPVFANDYLLTVLILILYFAYTGQAWNILMGFAGQLSLGHALYVGLGAYLLSYARPAKPAAAPETSKTNKIANGSFVGCCSTSAASVKKTWPRNSSCC